MSWNCQIPWHPRLGHSAVQTVCLLHLLLPQPSDCARRTSANISLNSPVRVVGWILKEKERETYFACPKALEACRRKFSFLKNDAERQNP